MTPFIKCASFSSSPIFGIIVSAQSQYILDVWLGTLSTFLCTVLLFCWFLHMALGITKCFLYFCLKNIHTDQFAFDILEPLPCSSVCAGQVHYIIPFIELGNSLISLKPFSWVLSCISGEDGGIPNTLLENSYFLHVSFFQLYCHVLRFWIGCKFQTQTLKFCLSLIGATVCWQQIVPIASTKNVVYWEGFSEQLMPTVVVAWHLFNAKTCPISTELPLHWVRLLFIHGSNIPVTEISRNNNLNKWSK